MINRAIKWLKAVLENLINSGYEAKTTEPTLLTSIRVLNIIDSILLLIGFMFLYELIEHGPMVYILTVLISISLLIIKMFFMRSYQNPLLFGHLTTVLVLISMCSGFVIMIGFYDTGFSWIFIIPLLGALLTDLKGCLLYLMLSLLMVFVFYLLTEHHFIPLYGLSAEFYSLFSFMHRFFSLIIIGLVLGCFLYERRELEKKLLKINKVLGISENKYRNQANFDHLTKVFNRNPFMTYFDKAIAVNKQNNKLILAYIDLDAFKQINDSYGHPVGDELLKLTVKRLQNIIKTSDAIGRLGGDEFVILTSDIETKEDAEKFAERLVDAFHRPFIIDNNEIRATISLGIAFYPDDGMTPAALMRHADEALYKAKQAGRNNYQFYGQLE